MPSAVNSCLPCWRIQAWKRLSLTSDWKPNVSFALDFDATSAEDSMRESQVQVLSSGTSTPASEKIFGLASTTRQLMPALMPYRVSLILPESTVPSMNFEVSTSDRSSRASRLPYSEM